MRGIACPTAAAALAASLALALAGCGSGASSASATHAGATRTVSVTPPSSESQFARHAGLAFGAFYRFIYSPYRAGEFRLSANTAALSRARLAAAFVSDQLAQATLAARSSRALANVVHPLEILGAGFKQALVRLRQGRFKLSEIQAANLAISSIKGSASSAGTSIQESVPSSI